MGSVRVLRLRQQGRCGGNVCEHLCGTVVLPSCLESLCIEGVLMVKG